MQWTMSHHIQLQNQKVAVCKCSSCLRFLSHKEKNVNGLREKLTAKIERVNEVSSSSNNTAWIIIEQLYLSSC